MKEKKLYITFSTSSDAIATESICKEKKISGKLVPIPRVLSASCGMAWECDITLEKEILEILKKEDIEYDNFAIL